jgi:hypothetical protein
MARAVGRNLSVITPTAGMPSFSAEMASCRLHDEQLPQSPIPVMMASHALNSAISARGAG